MAWHDATCTTLELEWEDGRPACRTCERRAPELTPMHPISPPAAPPDTPRSELVCTWPPKMFSESQSQDDEDSKLLALIRANIDDWTGTTSSRQLPTALQSAQQSSQQQPLNRRESDSSFRNIYSHLPNADSIRLLRLHGSGATNNPICCTLEIHRLRDPSRPIFEAFSYTWADSQGDSSLCKAIFLGPHYDVLPVTTNCLAALRHFRTVADRYVWVDAICINQFDIKERGHQVSLMQQIYSSAARVLTYLGDSNHAVEGAITSSRRNHRLSKDPSQNPALDLRAILRTPYFSRIWVIQEVLLNKTASVTFDGHTIHWDDFLSNVKTLPSSIEADPPGSWVEHFGSRRGDKSLFSLLVATRNCHCGDLRDRVYGLMGLVTEEEREILPVDYDISVQQQYIALAMHWLTSVEGQWQPKPSEVLSLALLPKATPFLPSWAPDWAPQSHQDMGRKCTSSVPLTFQLDTTHVERSSSGLAWPKSSIWAWSKSSEHSKNTKSQFRWMLDDGFWDSILSTDSRRKRIRLDSTIARLTGQAWQRLAEDAGWEPGASVRPLLCHGAMTLDAVHMLSISEGKVELTDINGKTLHGLQLTNSGELGPKEETFRQLSAHLHVLLDWKQALALKKHADKVYSLYGSFRIVCAPAGTPVPRRSWHVPTILGGLGNLDVEIIEHWLMDLFFYGVRAGSAFTRSPRGSAIQARWLKQCRLASSACSTSNMTFDINVGEDHQRIWPVMMGICQDVMEFVVENTVSRTISPTASERESSQDTTFYPHRLFIHDFKDSGLATCIQKAQRTSTRTHSSAQELCTYLAKVVKGHGDICGMYRPFGAALSDLDDRSLELLLDRTFPSAHSPVVDALLGPIKDSLLMRDGAWGPITHNQIVTNAWKLLRSLEIDIKFTLEQNLNILWIHVLTMEMVARLRGVLQQRLILKAIEDKMRNVQSIYLI